MYILFYILNGEKQVWKNHMVGKRMIEIWGAQDQITSTFLSALRFYDFINVN